MTGHTGVVRGLRSAAGTSRNCCRCSGKRTIRQAGHAAGHRYRTRVHATTGATSRSAPRRRHGARLQAGYSRSPPRSGEAPDFYYAEDYHQQYLAKNPGGYCGLGGTGVSCPVGARSDWLRGSRPATAQARTGSLSSAGARPDSGLPSDRSALRQPVMAAAGIRGGRNSGGRRCRLGRQPSWQVSCAFQGRGERLGGRRRGRHLAFENLRRQDAGNTISRFVRTRHRWKARCRPAQRRRICPRCVNTKAPAP